MAPHQASQNNEPSAPAQVLTSKRDAAKYKGPAADLWSSAVILFVMLSGAYPFEDARDPRNMKKTVEVRAADIHITNV